MPGRTASTTALLKCVSRRRPNPSNGEISEQPTAISEQGCHGWRRTAIADPVQPHGRPRQPLRHLSGKMTAPLPGAAPRSQSLKHCRWISSPKLFQLLDL